MTGRGSRQRTSEPTCSTPGVQDAEKGKKGRNFVPDEERQLFCSVLHVSQDPVVGNGQCAVAFWKRIHEHYDEHKSGGFRPARSLESKWSLIKHDVSKFIGVYAQILALNSSGKSAEDLLRDALELYCLKSNKGTEFAYLHCWYLVKDVSRWDQGLTHTVLRTPALKRPFPPSSKVESDNTRMVVQSQAPPSLEVPPPTGSATSGRGRRPQGCRSAKDKQKYIKMKEHAMRTQASAHEKMALATMRKAESLEDSNILMLFTCPNAHVTSPDAQEYLKMRRAIELKKLRRKWQEDEEKQSMRAEPVPTPNLSQHHEREDQHHDDVDEGNEDDNNEDHSEEYEESGQDDDEGVLQPQRATSRRPLIDLEVPSEEVHVPIRARDEFENAQGFQGQLQQNHQFQPPRQ